jgi:speckle-type POZ protein
LVKGTSEVSTSPGEGASSSEQSNHCSSLPLKVRASYKGQMKEMIATDRGTWASVSWPAKSIFHATYQLILEFRDASFAEGERQVLTHLSNLLDTQSMADVTFIVKNEKIGAHSAIIVSASPVICAMLEEGTFGEGRNRVIEVDDIDPSVFKEMLRYLYTGKAPMLDEDDMTEPLFLAADKYQNEALKDLCEQRLISKVNLETVVHYLVLAHLHSAPQLLEASFKFLEEHKKEIVDRAEWAQLSQNYLDLFFLAKCRMMGGFVEG